MKHLLCLLLGTALLTGCASKPAAKAPEQPKHEFIRHFPDGMTAPREQERFTIDGREMAIYVSEPAPNPLRGGMTYLMHYKGKQLSGTPDDWGRPHNLFYELRDVRTNKAILPMDYQLIRYVPGSGVYVLTSDRRMEFPSGLYHRAVSRWKTRPGDTMFYRPLRQLDVATGTLADSSVMHVERYGKPGDYQYVVLSREGWQEDLTSVSINAAIRGNDGKVLGVYLQVAPAEDRTIETLETFSLLHCYKDQGRQSYLLDVRLNLLAVAQAPVVSMGKFLATPAPGTAPGDELWHILQKDGTFAAPPGVVGVRPVSEEWSPNSRQKAIDERQPVRVYWWLVRYADGKWGRADATFEKMSGPIWSSATLVFPPTASVHQPRNRTQFYNRPVLLTQSANGWTAESVDPGYTPSPDQQKRVTAATANEAVGQLFAVYSSAKFADEARYQAQRDADQRFLAQVKQSQAEADWDHAVRTRNTTIMGQMVWARGGDAWYTYATAVIPASPLVLEQAAEHVKSPHLAADLRARAEQARRTLAAERERYHQSEAAALAAQQRATQTYGGSNVGTGSSLSVPQLSQQQQNYRNETQLNQQIYGTKWDPYK